VPPLLLDLLRPHRRTIAALLSATLVQMAMTVAVPWPLKSILDNVVGNHPAPLWISWLLPVLGGNTKVHIAEAAALLTVLIAAVTGAAMYLAKTARHTRVAAVMDLPPCCRHIALRK
jgi:ABC-type multidrug transport system fused ATPase/permease subunit